MSIGKASVWLRLKPPESPTMLIEISLLLAMANPASAACTRAGGTLTFVQSDKGEQGVCTLPSGVVCDEWEFFRGECPAMKKPEDSKEAPKGKKSSS
jgi:putative hemolysin